jgi:phosphoglycerate dehydrogenase-like enzyme
MTTLAVIAIAEALVTLALVAALIYCSREAARERRELYDRLQAGTLEDYRINRTETEPVKAEVSARSVGEEGTPKIEAVRDYGAAEAALRTLGG